MRSGAKAKRETATHLISHPVRVQIVTIANERDVSPARYIEEVMGISPAEYPEDYKRAVSHIAFHFRKLWEGGCLEIVDEIPRRGGTEKVFRGTDRAHFTDEEWAEVPPDERGPITTVTWQGLMARTEAARLGGTIDSRDDRWLAWTVVKFDERGWDEMTTVLTDCFAELERVRKDAEGRLEETGEEAIPATFALLGYESPGSSFYEDAPSYGTE